MIWNPYPKTRPEKSGYYLVIYEGGPDGKTVGADVEGFYNKGDLIDCLPSDIDGSPERRLIDSIMNRPVFVEKPGFYTAGENSDGTIHHWEVKPIFWAFLPELPEGYKYILEDTGNG